MNKTTEDIVKDFLDKQIRFFSIHDMLVNGLINNLQKLNYHEAGSELESIGFSEFCGNQHNEEWRLSDKAKAFITEYVKKEGYLDRASTGIELEKQIEITRKLLKNNYLKKTLPK